MSSLHVDHVSLCSNGALALALACVASAALGAAVVSAVALFAGERKRKSSMVVSEKKRAKFPSLAPTKPAVAVASVTPCCPAHGREHEHERDENAAPSSPCPSSEPSNKGDPFDARPRSSYLSWDDYFMALAFLSAQRSKDPNKQVGACIVSPDRIILGIGYNGFPRGCADSRLPWAKKAASGGALATKYPYVCHAEMNAVLNKNAASVAGATLYVTMFPCNECSKLLIQAGIGEVVFYEDKQADGRPASSPASGGILPTESYAASRTLLALAGVTTRQHAPAEALVLRVAPLDEAAKGRKSKSSFVGGGGIGGVLHAKAA